MGLALDSFPSQSIILHLDLLTFPTEELQISLVCHFISVTWLIYLFNFFFFLAIMQQIANALQFQNNTISIEYNPFIHIHGKKKGIKGKEGTLISQSPGEGGCGAGAQHRGQRPPSPQCPVLLPLPRSPTGAINHLHKTSPTHHLTQLSALSPFAAATPTNYLFACVSTNMRN